MRDYTYQDMLRMQEEAANRVREMKKRATIAVESENEQKPQKRPLPDAVKHISLPVVIDTPDNAVQDTANGSAEEKHSDGLLDLISRDNDALLILSLLAVLSAEKNDYLTSGALLYLLL